MKKLAVFVINMICIFSAAHAHSGWVITQRHSTGDGFIRFETLMIQNKMLKSSGLDGAFILDLPLNEQEFCNNMFE